jgi:hypothetical protein
MIMSKEDWQEFDKRHGHSRIEFLYDIWGPISRWLARRREEKKRQDKAHQEAYARALRAEEFRKAEMFRTALTLQRAENIRFRKGSN